MSDSFGDTVSPVAKAWNRAAQIASRNTTVEECAKVAAHWCDDEKYTGLGSNRSHQGVEG